MIHWDVRRPLPNSSYQIEIEERGGTVRRDSKSIAPRIRAYSRCGFSLIPSDWLLSSPVLTEHTNFENNSVPASIL